jgi:hypothetical protein
MKFRILFDNYFIYLLIFGGVSIFKIIVFNEKISFGPFVILGFLWLSDLIFEKKMYLLNLKMNETDIEVTYLNIFLKEKKYIKGRELIRISYIKNNWFLNKFEILEIVEKESFDIINFKVIQKYIQENIEEKINNEEIKATANSY